MKRIDVIVSHQIDFVEYLQSTKEDVQEAWGRWRDAQGLDDVGKMLVDQVFNEYICTLDKLIDTLLPF